jgi:hypothetical protein
MSQNRLEVIQHIGRSCNFSKSVDLRIGQKTIVTPNFSLRVKNSDELDLLLRFKTKHSLNFLSSYVIRLLDTPRTLYHKIQTMAQTNLLGQSAESAFSSSLNNDLVIIDPALEYLHYHAEDTLSKIVSLFFLPKTLRDYAQRCMKEKKVREKKDFLKWQEASHRRFWTDIYEDDAKRMRFIRDFHTLEIKNKADILIPPVPLITSSHLLDIAISINDRGRELARDKRESADYFLLRTDILRDEDVMDRIKQHIENAEDTRFTIFKFKYMNLNSEERTREKSAYKSLLMELALISQRIENKAFMLLEAGNQVFPSALTGFDIISSSFNGDKEDRHIRREHSPFAKWYDPEYMIFRSRDELMQIITNNGDVLPCDCPICITPSAFLTNDPSEYNKNVKLHYLFRRNSEMSEIFDAIKNKTVTMGANRLQRSQLKNLVDLVPYSK